MQKNKGEKSMEKTVKEIFEEGKAINLMTPVGYIYLNADKKGYVWREKSDYECWRSRNRNAYFNRLFIFMYSC